MPIEDVQKGMSGVGITVFDGTTREEFIVHILGTLTNAMGPKRNLIIARLEGGPLESTGVIQGMSGSPVYIDDRLVGAISYSLGSFPKQAIAGITPIGEMLADDKIPLIASDFSSNVDAFELSDGGGFTFRESLFGPRQAFVQRPTDITSSGLTPDQAARFGTLLTPIATPLSLSGFDPELQDLWTRALRPVGMVATVGGLNLSQDQTFSTATLQPGDAIGANLITGDFSMSGSGTVTLVEDDRVYAFGHPFYNLGPARYPMTRTNVTTLLPSVASSARMSSVGEIIGTFDQDRATGIFGTLGPGPEMIPVSITLSSEERRLEETFNFEVINDRFFTPLLTYTGVLNTFFSWTRQVGAGTFEIDSSVALSGVPDVTLRNLFTGDSAATSAAATLFTSLSVLNSNPFKPVTIKEISIKITSSEASKFSTLERVWIDSEKLQAGSTVPLRLATRDSDGSLSVTTLMIALPEHIHGQVQLRVSDSTAFRQQTIQDSKHPAGAKTLIQLLRAINTTPQNDHLYISLIADRPGAIVRGELLPALPSSIISVLEGDRSSGDFRSLSHETVSSWLLQTSEVVTGSRFLSFNIEAR